MDLCTGRDPQKPSISKLLLALVVPMLPLQFAATDGAKHSAGCLELLLKHGAKTGKCCCLGFFCFASLPFVSPLGNKVNLIVKLILLRLDFADAVDNEFDMTAWLWACDHGRSACLQPLIDAGRSAPFLARPLSCCSRVARAGVSLALPPSNPFLASFRLRIRRTTCHNVSQPASLALTGGG